MRMRLLLECLLPGSMKGLIECSCLFHQVPSATLEFVRQSGVDVTVLQTQKAVAEYNRLAGKGAKVGGVFHSTC